MKAYFAIKFHEDSKNKELIETISKILEKKGIQTIVMMRDYENWSKIKFTPKQLMDLSFKEIEKSDMMIVDISEKGVGIGIEAGYAHSKGKPIIVIAKKGSDIPDTLRGIAKKVIFYSTPTNLAKEDLITI